MRIWLFAVFLIGSNLFSATTRDLVSSAASNMATADYYQAYRSYAFLEKAKLSAFVKEGLQNYIKLLFVVGTSRQRVEECNRLTTTPDQIANSKAAYVCGLNFIQNKEPAEALTVLNRLTPKSKFYIPGTILRASAEILKNQGEQALKILSSLDRKELRNLDLEGHYFLTKGRASVEVADYDEALKAYHGIGFESDFYFQAMEEAAWIAFRQKKLTEARALIDLILPFYGGPKALAGTPHISAATYFRLKYLKAYLGIFEIQNETAITEFNDLKAEFEIYSARIRSELNFPAAISVLEKPFAAWADRRGMPSPVNRQLEILADWGTPEQSLTLFKELLFLMAVRHEVKRVEKNKDIEGGDYQKKVKQLQGISWNQVSKTFKDTTNTALRITRTLALKSEMGKLELIWLNRSLGARSMEEILDNYQNQVERIEDYFVK